MEEKLEKQLLAKAQKGKVEAFEQLIVGYEKTLYHICLRMLNNEQEAYDATQEVCIKIWKQLHVFEGQSKLSTWIYRIAMNQCLDMMRKKKNKQEVSIYQSSKEQDDEWILEEKEGKDEINEHVEQIVLKEIVQTALSEVKDEYKQILILRDIEGYSYDEIGEILGLTTGTVKSRLSRARMSLKNILSQNKEPYKSFFRQRSREEGQL